MNKSSYHALTTLKLAGPHLANQPLELPPIIHIDDPASATFVDFERHRPPTIPTYRSLGDARAEMDLFNLPALLVTDLDKHVIGIITSEDILGEKPFNEIFKRLDLGDFVGVEGPVALASEDLILGEGAIGEA